MTDPQAEHDILTVRGFLASARHPAVGTARVAFRRVMDRYETFSFASEVLAELIASGLVDRETVEQVERSIEEARP